MMDNESSLHWSSNYSHIKYIHDAAYRLINEANKLEEQEKYKQAIDKYKQGISFIDYALNIQIECPENPDSTWQKARVMIKKIKKTRAKVLTHINSIEAMPEFVARNPAPSYEEAMSSSSDSSSLRTYSELATDLESLKMDEIMSGPAEIIYTQNNVQLYFIMPDGTVTCTAEYLTLKIGILQGINEGQASTTFLQIGDSVYPLVPGVTPCSYSEDEAFILPDVHSKIPGSSIGIILPSEARAEFYNLLEHILNGEMSQKPLSFKYQIAKRETPEGISGTISRGIVQGACYLSQGLIKGAEKTGELLNYGTPVLLNHVQPAPAVAPISTNVQKGFEIAHDVTSTAANVTGYVATQVGTATMAIGRFLAPYIQREGTRLLSASFNMSPEEASEKVNDALTVAAGAVEGFSTVYSGLETSAKILGNNLANNTVKVVEHKYGQPSGVLAGNTLYTIGNIATVSYNVSHITPKGIVKKTAKQTGQALVKDFRNN